MPWCAARCATSPGVARGGFGFAWRVEGVDYAEGSLELELDQDELRVVEERIQKPGREIPLYEIKERASGPSHDIKVAYDNFSRGGKKPLITCTDQQLVMSQLQSAARFANEHTRAARTVPAVCRRHVTALAGTMFLDPAPRLMRGYAPLGSAELRGDGSNLSSVLHKLCGDEKKKARLLGFVASLPEQNITGIDFVTTSDRRNVKLALVETFGRREEAVDATLLSDGTLRVLAVAAALLSAPEGSLAVVEEIDIGVHPSRAEHLLRNIKEVADERRLRILLTTHDPALMDALPDGALLDVVVCWRDPDTGASRLQRLGDLERSASLLAQGPLGRLVTRGVVDRFLKSPSVWSKEKAQAWARDLFELVDG